MAAVTALALLAGACVSSGDPGVTVDAKSANLVFGVDDPAEATPEDETAQIEYLDEVSPITIEVASRAPRTAAAPRPPLRFQGIDVPLYLDDEPTPRSTVCHSTIRSPAPKQVLAAFAVPRNLKSGTYLWGGTYTLGEASQPTKVESLPTELRLLRNVTDLGPQTPASPENSYRYEVVQAAGEYKPGQRQFLVSTYVVNPRPPVDSTRLPSQVEQVARPPQGRPPDSGLVLTKTQLVDVNGQPFPDRPAFEPLVGVFLLPLPVTPGEQFESAAVDPKSGKVVRMSGTVGREARINACGEPADGYEVTAGVNVTTAAGSSQYFTTYVVAPQLGVIILREAVEVRPAPPTRAPQATTGKQKTQRLCGPAEDRDPAVDRSDQCTLPGVDTQGHEVPSQTVPSQSTPEDAIVPGEEGQREETAFNIGFLDPDPELLPLSEFP